MLELHLAHVRLMAILISWMYLSAKLLPSKLDLWGEMQMTLIAKLKMIDRMDAGDRRLVRLCG